MINDIAVGILQAFGLIVISAVVFFVLFQIYLRVMYRFKWSKEGSA